MTDPKIREECTFLVCAASPHILKMWFFYNFRMDTVLVHKSTIVDKQAQYGL